MQVKSLSYVLYVLRWMVLAIPGAWFLVQVQHVVENTYLAMVISQGLLGAAVYFVDKRIFKVNNWELGEVSKAVAAREALLRAIAALGGGRKENSEMGLIEVTLRTENERLMLRMRKLEEENRKLRALAEKANALVDGCKPVDCKLLWKEKGFNCVTQCRWFALKEALAALNEKEAKQGE